MENTVCKNMNWQNYMKNLLIGFSIVFLATYIVTLFQVDGGDFVAHISWAKRFNFTYLGEYLTKVTPYPLWHFLVKACKVLFDIEWAAAASLVTATVNGFSFLAAVWTQKVLFPEMDDREGHTIFWAICLMFVGPLYFPRFNDIYYLGQGTGNIWHNPSNIMVKLFAIVAFCLIAKIVNKKEQATKCEIIALVITLVLSVIAKPAFLQAIIPGLGLYMLIRLWKDKSKEEFKKFVIMAASFVPAVIIMFIQLYITMFGTTRGSKMESELAAGEAVVLSNYQQGMGIAWGKTYAYWTPNIYVSFLLAFAFPLFVFLFNYRKLIKDKVVQLVLCYELAAWLESVLLYQKGPGEHQGNFFWASYLSMFMTWMIMLYHYLISLKEMDKKTVRNYVYMFGGIGLFAMHLILGIMYAINFVWPYMIKELG